MNKYTVLCVMWMVYRYCNIAGRKWKKPNPKALNKASKRISKLTKKKPSKNFFDDIEKTRKPSKSLKK